MDIFNFLPTDPSKKVVHQQLRIDCLQVPLVMVEVFSMSHKVEGQVVQVVLLMTRVYLLVIMDA